MEFKMLWGRHDRSLSERCSKYRGGKERVDVDTLTILEVGIHAVNGIGITVAASKNWKNCK